MLLSDWYAKRKEQQLEAAIAAAEKRGKAEGRRELLKELEAKGVDVSQVERKPEA